MFMNCQQCLVQQKSAKMFGEWLTWAVSKLHTLVPLVRNAENRRKDWAKEVGVSPL